MLPSKRHSVPAASPSRDITRTLIELTAARDDRPLIEDRLYSQVYAELRAMAASLLRLERADHTLRPTELVHEAYMRLVARERITWEGRAHFFGTAARAMRQILVDHARRRRALKRGRGFQRVSLHPDLASGARRDLELLELDDCLTRLAGLDPRMAQVVELRVFADMTSRDVAYVLGVSERTVEGDWAVAKKWLRHELAGDA